MDQHWRGPLWQEAAENVRVLLENRVPKLVDGLKHDLEGPCLEQRGQGPAQSVTRKGEVR